MSLHPSDDQPNAAASADTPEVGDDDGGGPAAREEQQSGTTLVSTAPPGIDDPNSALRSPAAEPEERGGQPPSNDSNLSPPSCGREENAGPPSPEAGSGHASQPTSSAIEQARASRNDDDNHIKDDSPEPIPVTPAQHEISDDDILGKERSTEQQALESSSQSYNTAKEAGDGNLHPATLEPFKCQNEAVAKGCDSPVVLVGSPGPGPDDRAQNNSQEHETTETKGPPEPSSDPTGRESPALANKSGKQGSRGSNDEQNIPDGELRESAPKDDKKLQANVSTSEALARPGPVIQSKGSRDGSPSKSRGGFKPTVPQSPQFQKKTPAKPRQPQDATSFTTAQSVDVFGKGLRAGDDRGSTSPSKSRGGTFKPTVPQPPRFQKERSTRAIQQGKSSEVSLAQSVDVLRKGLRDGGGGGADNKSPSSNPGATTPPTPTVPQAPKFRTSHQRKLPKSTEDQEKELMEYYKANPIKAKPIATPKTPAAAEVHKSGAVHTPTRRVTEPKPFHFLSDERAAARRSPDKQKQKSSSSTSTSPGGSKQAEKQSSSSPRKYTKVQPFRFLSDERAAAHSKPSPKSPMKEEEDLRECKKQFRARPMPKFSHSQRRLASATAPNRDKGSPGNPSATVQPPALRPRSVIPRSAHAQRPEDDDSPSKQLEESTPPDLDVPTLQPEDNSAAVGGGMSTTLPSSSHTDQEALQEPSASREDAT